MKIERSESNSSMDSHAAVRTVSPSPSSRSTLAAAALALLFAMPPARAQLTINGVSDKGIYNDSVTISVPVQSGFEYEVLLDTNTLTAGAAFTVNAVDYHELRVFQTNQTTLEATNRLIRFIVRSSERVGTEDGLPPWTPWPWIPSSSNELAGAHLRIIAPQDFPAGYEIPVVAWVEDDLNHAVRVNGAVAAAGQAPITIRRGVGSGFLSAGNPAGELNYAAAIQQLNFNKVINLESNTTWNSVSGTISGSIVWPENSRIAITGNVTVPAGSTITIGEGAIVRLNAGVDITLNGEMVINGTTNRPVVFMPVTREQPWGGFLLQANTSRIFARDTIFTGSGAVQNWFGTGGHPSSHRREQALFFCSNSPTLTLTDCAAIYLAGQLSHSVNGGSFTLDHFLMQHTTTGGEHTGAAFKVNDSAFIECPDATTDFVDGDNDALYIENGTQGFTNTLFGWTKDDGVDSGASGAGLLNFQSCWFESIFHEGNSLSGNAKIVNHYGDVFINCGQGLEAGYQGPIGTLGGCLVTGNLVGGRFGDNYTGMTYTGFLRATNSLLIYNYRDVWGRNWQDWEYRTSAMQVENNFLTVPNGYHADNVVWQPENDGWRLAAFMTTPPDADVGVGIALSRSMLGLDAITNRVPVRLSSFTTNAVTVEYQLDSAQETVASGTVTFQPGETLKFIDGFSAPAGDAGILRLQLSHPQHAEITGGDTIYFLPGIAANSVTLIPTGSIWRYLDTGENAGTIWRTNDFDDASWRSGPAELGYGDGDEATAIRSSGVNGRIITTYFRHAFVVDDPAAYRDLTVNLRRDDGGVVYLNGTEIFRSNLTNAANVPVLFSDFAGNNIGSESAFFSTNVSPALLRAGTNVLAAEIHQISPTSSDVSFELRLDAAMKPVLQPLHFGNSWLLFWSDPSAILEATENLSEPWVEIEAVSPFAIITDQPMKFFRLRQPSIP